MLKDISSSLSRAIHRDQAQAAITTLAQPMTGEGTQAAASSDQNSRQSDGLDTRRPLAYISAIDISTIERSGA